MKITDFIWLERVVEKIWSKHHVEPEEVEEVFKNRPYFRKGAGGKVKGEDLYYALGQTDTGRYLFSVFIHKQHGEALVLTARDMDKKEKSFYQRS